MRDRSELPAFAPEFAKFAPEVVIDTFAMTGPDARAAAQTFRGLARRWVVLSSMDVYRAYDRFRGHEPGPPDPAPLAEDAPLRGRLYPYRGQAKGEDDLLFHYEKVLVERAALGEPGLPGTVLRLPCVYGPGDYQHRTFEYRSSLHRGHFADQQVLIFRGQRIVTFQAKKQRILP